MPALTEPRVRRVAIAWVGILGVVLALLTAAVNSRSLQFSDRLLLLMAQGPASHLLDLAMGLVSLAGSVEITGLAMLILVINTRSREPLGWVRWVPLVVFVAVTLVEIVAKDVVYQPPPPLDVLRVRLPGLNLPTAGSFPSGHMVRVTLILGLLALRLARRTGRMTWLGLCIVAVWTVGYSRVYLGHHWPSDVAGGILLGGIGLAACLGLSPRGSIGELDQPGVDSAPAG